LQHKKVNNLIPSLFSEPGKALTPFHEAFKTFYNLTEINQQGRTPFDQLLYDLSEMKEGGGGIFDQKYDIKVVINMISSALVTIAPKDEVNAVVKKLFKLKIAAGNAQ